MGQPYWRALSVQIDTFIKVRFLHDEHAILWTASKCLDLRRYAPAPGQDEEDFEDQRASETHYLMDD